MAKSTEMISKEVIKKIRINIENSHKSYNFYCNSNKSESILGIINSQLNNIQQVKFRNQKLKYMIAFFRNREILVQILLVTSRDLTITSFLSAIGAPIGFITTLITYFFTVGNEVVKLPFKGNEN